MKPFRGFYFLGIIVALSMILISCSKSNVEESSNHLSNHESLLTSKNREYEDDLFKISSEEVSSIVILDNPVAKDIKQETTAVIDNHKDIKEIVDVLNNSPAYMGAATADFYRIMEITSKDGTKTLLEFGGQGRFFKDINSGVFFGLDPENKFEDLNAFIDQAEQKYSK